MIEIQTNSKTLKTFVFQKQETQQSELIQIEVEAKDSHVDLTSLFQEHVSTNDHSFFIYDPQSNQFKSIHKIGSGNGKVPHYYLDPTFVLIKYRKKIAFSEDQSSMLLHSEDSNIRNLENRSKQRTIAQVIALVKHWRNLHMTAMKPNNPKKKMNLQDAAKEVGVSKKSLDDYYCQLRLAELHNFNFYDNFDQKMGKLRTYVKEHRVDEAARIRHHKHPRTLKIIEEFNIDPKMSEYIQREKQMAEESIMLMKQESIQLIQENPILSEKFEHNIFTIQNNFYQNFEFLMDDPSDPFLLQNGDFMKKDFQSESQQFNFF